MNHFKRHDTRPNPNAPRPRPVVSGRVKNQTARKGGKR